MADKDSEQTIDQQPSISPIDQITKIPAQRPKEKVKNPKRVAAGKKLSQYSKKAKEQQRLVQENNEEENIDEKNSWLPETSFTTVITVLGLGLRAIDLFLRYKSQQHYSAIDDKQYENPVETTKSEADKIKVSNPQHIGGME